MDRLIRRLNGPRGSALLSVGFTSAWHGIAYFPIAGDPSLAPSGLQMIGSFVPLAVYGGAWLVVSVIATAGAFTDRDGYPRPWDRWGFAGFVGIITVWAFSYFIGFATGVTVDIDLDAPTWSGPWYADLWEVLTIVTVDVEAENRQWVSAAIYLGIAGLTLAASRMRNPFVIDVRFDRRQRRES